MLHVNRTSNQLIIFRISVETAHNLAVFKALFQDSPA